MNFLDFHEKKTKKQNCKHKYIIVNIKNRKTRKKITFLIVLVSKFKCLITCPAFQTQKMKFFIKDFFGKYDQIPRKSTTKTLGPRNDFNLT